MRHSCAFEASVRGMQLFTLHSGCSPPPTSRRTRETDASRDDHSQCNDAVNQCVACSGFI